MEKSYQIWIRRNDRNTTYSIFSRDVINPLTNPHKMVESVVGNIMVYYSNNLRVFDEMRCFIDEEYECKAEGSTYLQLHI